MSEANVLKNWKLKLAILSAIVVPSVTATANFYKLELKLSERMSNIELQSERNFADKPTMQQLTKDVSGIKNDIAEIKTLLRTRR